jgi:hypothetical protein
MRATPTRATAVRMVIAPGGPARDAPRDAPPPIGGRSWPI